MKRITRSPEQIALDRAIGKLIRERREYYKLSRLELAATMDFDQTIISRIEDAKHSASVYRLYQICETLNLNLGETLDTAVSIAYKLRPQ